jgi:hypothetical protein
LLRFLISHILGTCKWVSGHPLTLTPALYPVPCTLAAGCPRPPQRSRRRLWPLAVHNGGRSLLSGSDAWSAHDGQASEHHPTSPPITYGSRALHRHPRPSSRRPRRDGASKNQKVSIFVWDPKYTSRMLIASIFEEIQKIDIFDLRSKKSKCSQSHSNYMCTNENAIALLPIETQCCIH